MTTPQSTTPAGNPANQVPQSPMQVTIPVPSFGMGRPTPGGSPTTPGHQPVGGDDVRLQPLQTPGEFSGPMIQSGMLVDGRRVAAPVEDPKILAQQMKDQTALAKEQAKAQDTAQKNQDTASAHLTGLLKERTKAIRPPKVAAWADLPQPSTPGLGGGLTPFYKNFIRPFAMKQAIGVYAHGGPMAGSPKGAWAELYAQNLANSTGGKSLGQMLSPMLRGAGDAVRTGDISRIQFPANFA